MGTIAFHRRQQQMSQQKLSELVGVSRSTVSAWELMTTAPSEEQKERLAGIFKINPGDLHVRAEPFKVRDWRIPEPLESRPPLMRTGNKEFMAGVRYALGNLMTAGQAMDHIEPRPKRAWFDYCAREQKIGTRIGNMWLYLPEDLVVLCTRKGWLYVEGPAKNGARDE